IVRPTTKPTLEAETKKIISSPTPQLTDPTIEVQASQPKSPSHITPKPDLVIHPLSVPKPTLTITRVQATFKGESSAYTTTISPIEETPSHTEGEKADMETEEKETKVANVE
nr:hypothetical protein [Tanacetum cinerariifolium]